MFSIEFLHVIRKFEVDTVTKFLDPQAIILEVGGGTGFQVKELRSLGFNVTSIDVPDSSYREQRIGPVIDYDGREFPFGTGVFDVVFTSNTLEHIGDLRQFHKESRRVLKPGGYCIHIMPSPSWRLWTSLTSYIKLAQHIFRLLLDLIPRGLSRSEARRALNVVPQMARLIRGMDATRPGTG